MADDIDITSDLTGGADDANLADASGGVVQNNVSDDTQSAARHDDAVHVNKVQQPDKVADSLRDQLTDAFKAPEEKQPAVREQKAQQGAPEITKDADGKWRRMDGTYASAEEVAALNTQQQEQNNVPDTVLSRMTETERNQFQALPAELRSFVGRTMEAVEGQAARFGEYNLLEQELIGPRRQAWAAEGMSPAVAINQLFALSDFAARDPSAFVLWYAEQAGVDLDAALDARDQQQPADPHMRQLQSTVQSLQDTVNGWQTNAQSHVHQQNVNDVRTFAEERDGAGALKRPYLTEVLNEFTANISTIRNANPNMSNVEVLNKAYENACWTNSSVRQRMQQAEETRRTAEAEAKAKAARAASASINGGPAGDPPLSTKSNSNLSLRDELVQAFANAG